MTDRGRELTDKLLVDMERKIRREYRRAVKETTDKLNDYLRRFRVKDEKWQEWVRDGVKTPTQYRDWRVQQMIVGNQWQKLRDTLAADYHNASKAARAIIDGARPEVYALNFNYATFLAETGARVDTAFTLVNKDAVARILRDNPELLPPPGARVNAEIAAGRALAWQSGQIQSVTLQAILQGESIPHIAQRIARTMGERNHADSIRYARTATTAAENAGRRDAFFRAEKMGVDMEQEWRAVLDGRTRHAHRQLDGQRRKVGEPFEVDGEEIMYPGDPSAPSHLIWNCRCSLRGRVAGLEPRARKYRQIDGYDSYEAWKADKKSTSDPITKGEEIAELMRRARAAEYRRKG